MKEQIAALIAERADTWERAKKALSSNEYDTFDRENALLTDLDERIHELRDLHESNQLNDAYREQHSGLVPGGDRHQKTPFHGVGFKTPYIRHSTRTMSDEEVFMRDFIEGREPQSHFDVDFSNLEVRVNEDHSWEVRDILTTTSGASAQVPNDFAANIYRHLVAFNPMLRAGASVDNTPDGRSKIYPKTTADGTAAIVGEGTAIAENDPTFSSLTLDAWKYGQLLEVTNEMIEDNAYDIVGHLASTLGRNLGVATGAAYMTGSGTNAPRGVITAVANDLGTAVQIASATVEADNLIDVLYSVSEPYRARGGAWFFNDATAKRIRKLKNGNDQYVFEPSFQAGQPDRLLGYPVYIAPAMAGVGSANLSVAFGDPTVYQVRQAPLRIERSDHFGFNRDVAALRAVLRVDGDLLDSTSTTFALADTD